MAAVRTWVKVLGTMVGTGALAGAGQLGTGYGLGILRRDVAFADAASWHGQLAWLALMAAVAVPMGAMSGLWIARVPAEDRGPGLRVVAALAAAVGAAVMFPLVVHPAHGLQLPDPGSPALDSVLATSAGLVVGTGLAIAALSVPAVAGDLVVSTIWVWAAALVSAVWTLGAGKAWAVASLGQLPLSGNWTPILLLGAPALIALAVAVVARIGGSPRLAVALCGLPGPVLVATCYLVGGPGGPGYRYALIGAVVGVAVSVLVALASRPGSLARPAAPHPTPVAPGPTPAGWPVTVEAGEPARDIPAQSGPGTAPDSASGPEQRSTRDPRPWPATGGSDAGTSTVTGPEAATSPPATSAPAKPKTTGSKTAKPKANKPRASKPATATPKADGPDAGTAGTKGTAVKPDTGEPQSREPQSRGPETGGPDPREATADEPTTGQSTAGQSKPRGARTGKHTSAGSGTGKPRQAEDSAGTAAAGQVPPAHSTKVSRRAQRRNTENTEHVDWVQALRDTTS